MGILRAIVYFIALIVFMPVIAVVMAVGSIVSSTEDEFWNRFWHDTPITETKADRDIMTQPQAPEEKFLKKAA